MSEPAREFDAASGVASSIEVAEIERGQAPTVSEKALDLKETEDQLAVVVEPGNGEIGAVVIVAGSALAREWVGEWLVFPAQEAAAGAAGTVFAEVA